MFRSLSKISTTPALTFGVSIGSLIKVRMFPGNPIQEWLQARMSSYRVGIGQFFGQLAIGPKRMNLLVADAVKQMRHTTSLAFRKKVVSIQRSAFQHGPSTNGAFAQIGPTFEFDGHFGFG